MSKASEAFNRIKNKKVFNGEADQYDVVFENDDKDIECLNELVTRDEPKQVIHENTFKSFGRCLVCKTNVSMKFHRSFCGECGNRLVWEGERK